MTQPGYDLSIPGREMIQAVLAKIRHGRRLSSYLTPQQMQGVGGFTETFDADLPPADLRSSPRPKNSSSPHLNRLTSTSEWQSR